MREDASDRHGVFRQLGWGRLSREPDEPPPGQPLPASHDRDDKRRAAIKVGGLDPIDIAQLDDSSRVRTAMDCHRGAT
jgi:hypothetical protein